MQSKYVEGVMNYTGSKFKLLDQILPEFDYTKKIFFDVFCGGGSIYSNVVDKYDTIFVNDIIEDLIGIHSRLVYSDTIINNTKKLCPGKDNVEGYAKLRDDYNLYPNSDKLWALMLSCTNNMMRFNQKFKFNQTYGKRGWNDNTTKKVTNYLKHIRNYKDKLIFLSRSFTDIEILSSDIMFYCDPPYSNTEAGYNAFWKKDNDNELYEFLKKIDKKGASFMISGVLTHDNKPCKILEKLISDGYKYKELNCDYNKVSKKGNKNTKEIIIKNY